MLHFSNKNSPASEMGIARQRIFGTRQPCKHEIRKGRISRHPDLRKIVRKTAAQLGVFRRAFVHEAPIPHGSFGSRSGRARDIERRTDFFQLPDYVGRAESVPDPQCRQTMNFRKRSRHDDVFVSPHKLRAAIEIIRVFRVSAVKHKDGLFGKVFGQPRKIRFSNHRAGRIAGIRNEHQSGAI